MAEWVGRPRIVLPGATMVMMGVVVATGWLPSKYGQASVSTANMFDYLPTTWSDEEKAFGNESRH